MPENRKIQYGRSIIMMYFLLVIGFILLIKGADIFVGGASAIAKFFGIPSVIIGLTVVAMGTSMPETAVSISAGLSGSNEIAFGNIVGSNIFNLLMVVGISAMIFPVATETAIIRRDIFWSLGGAVAMLVTALDGNISRSEGIILLLAMAAYMFILIKGAKPVKPAEPAEKVGMPKSILCAVAGLGAVILGGNMVTENAGLIAESLGMSETLIGLTVVAVGTSLPELATSVAAARKGDSGLALGNVVGSNIYNIFMILGATSVISPVTVSPFAVIDSAVLIGATVLIYIFCRSKNITSSLEGAICVATYITYSVYIALR